MYLTSLGTRTKGLPAACLRAALAGLVILIATQGVSSAGDDAPFTKVAQLDGSFVLPDTGGTVVRAFMLTRSSGNCTATLNESNNAVAGTTLYCGVRAPSLYGGLPGVMVTIFFPGPVSDPLILSVVVHQDGARQYGAPVICTPSEGC